MTDEQIEWWLYPLHMVLGAGLVILMAVLPPSEEKDDQGDGDIDHYHRIKD